MLKESGSEQRKHELLMRAYRAGVPESELSDDLDALEQTVQKYEGEHHKVMEEFKHGASEGSEALTRSRLLNEAFKLGVKLSDEESETISIIELQQRINDFKGRQRRA